MFEFSWMVEHLSSCWMTGKNLSGATTLEHFSVFKTYGTNDEAPTPINPSPFFFCLPTILVEV